MVETIEKNSPTTGKMAVYTKKSKISRLPKYLIVNFIRFQWKATERVKAKILKKVQFPFELDMIPFCTPDLQLKLQVGRDRLKDVFDKRADNKKRGIIEPAQSVKTQRAILQEIGADKSLTNDIGGSPSGQYDLVAGTNIIN